MRKKNSKCSDEKKWVYQEKKINSHLWWKGYYKNLIDIGNLLSEQCKNNDKTKTNLSPLSLYLQFS